LAAHTPCDKSLSLLSAIPTGRKKGPGVKLCLPFAPSLVPLGSAWERPNARLRLALRRAGAEPAAEVARCVGGREASHPLRYHAKAWKRCVGATPRRSPFWG
jgi:hypothetical protein